MGIEPTRPAWKAGILPLNYTRISATLIILSKITRFVKRLRDNFLFIFTVIFYIRKRKNEVGGKSRFFSDSIIF